MSHSRVKTRERKRKKIAEEKIEKKMSMQTNGYTDLTPYNAITGSDKISKATLSNVKKKVNGSFNG